MHHARVAAHPHYSSLSRERSARHTAFRNCERTGARIIRPSLRLGIAFLTVCMCTSASGKEKEVPDLRRVRVVAIRRRRRRRREMLKRISRSGLKNTTNANARARAWSVRGITSICSYACLCNIYVELWFFVFIFKL